MKVVHKHDRVVAKRTRSKGLAHSDEVGMPDLAPPFGGADRSRMTEPHMLEAPKDVALAVQRTGGLVDVAAATKDAARIARGARQRALRTAPWVDERRRHRRGCTRLERHEAVVYVQRLGDAGDRLVRGGVQRLLLAVQLLVQVRVHEKAHGRMVRGMHIAHMRKRRRVQVVLQRMPHRARLFVRVRIRRDGRRRGMRAPRHKDGRLSDLGRERRRR